MSGIFGQRMAASFSVARRQDDGMEKNGLNMFSVSTPYYLLFFLFYKLPPFFSFLFHLFFYSIPITVKIWQMLEKSGKIRVVSR